MKYLATIKRSDVKDYLKSYTPFRCGSCIGTMSEGGEFVVISYATVIARVDMSTRNLTYFDNTHYSSTTSFIQKAVKEAYL